MQPADPTPQKAPVAAGDGGGDGGSGGGGRDDDDDGVRVPISEVRARAIDV